MYLAGITEADELLASDPFALLIGMVLDQQIPLERAFAGPYELRERLGGRLDVEFIAEMDPETLAAAFSTRPALHRFPAAMAERTQALARLIVERYGKDAAAVWTSAKDGAELLANVRKLPGFGEQKARIFVALLAKQFGVRPPGWEKAAGNFGKAGTFASVADITSPEALERVRDYKRQMKAAAKSVAHLETPKAPAPAARAKASSGRPGAATATAKARKRS